ncbi:MAG: hypothetical protein NDI61_13780 [Bdellovibrionaceae bacterium]|nr:hypothetical protein [Pseudobdellovibrionaceae bacterium]
MSLFASSLLTIVTNSLLQFALLIGGPALGGIALSWLARLTNSVYSQFLFPRLGLLVFGTLGVPVHEFSHYLFCKIFGLKVQKVKWFDPKGRGGSHGAVVHSYDPWSVRHRIGHVFVGLAPALVGPALIGGGLWLIGLSNSMDSLRGLPALPAPAWIAFLYVAFAISSQLELSKEDLKVTVSGLLPTFFVVLMLNGILAALQTNGILVDWNQQIIGWSLHGLELWSRVLGVTAILSALHFGLAWLLTSVLHWIFGKGPINPFLSCPK